MAGKSAIEKRVEQLEQELQEERQNFFGETENSVKKFILIKQGLAWGDYLSGLLQGKGKPTKNKGKKKFKRLAYSAGLLLLANWLEKKIKK